MMTMMMLFVTDDDDGAVLTFLGSIVIIDKWCKWWWWQFGIFFINKHKNTPNVERTQDLAEFPNSYCFICKLIAL